MSKNNGTVEIYCILDRSGSMTMLEESTIEGFNSFIKKQKKEIGKARVTLAIFDERYEIVYSNKKLKKAPELNSDVYYARGLTALNDAIAKTLEAASEHHTKDGAPSKTICLIVTDGYENASTDYPGEEGRKKIKGMIRRLQDKKGWDFFFIGSEIDAIAVGSGIGIPIANTARVAGSHKGTLNAYAAMGMGATASASGESVSSTQDLYDELMED